jgi:hypothetical protein
MRWIVKNVLPAMATVNSWISPNGTLRPVQKSASDVARVCWEIEKPTKGTATYLNGTEPLETAKEARNEANRKALWKYGMKAAGLAQGDTMLKDWQ